MLNSKLIAQTSQKGFTLIELILVIVLMGILGVTAIGFDYDTSPMTAEMARRKIAEDIRYAQNQAITTKTTHGFIANSSTTYEIYQGSSGNPIASPIDGSNMNISLSTKFRDTVFVNGSFPTFEVSFDENGKPSNVIDLTITVSSGNTSKTLLVIPNSGTVILP